MKRFTKRNEPFICEHCKREVPAGTRGTNRNHCPFCLCSKHVDVNPGDRQAVCGGLMRPIRAYYLSGRVTIIHRCDWCGIERQNEAAEFPCEPADDRELIYALMRKAAMEV